MGNSYQPRRKRVVLILLFLDRTRNAGLWPWRMDVTKRFRNVPQVRFTHPDTLAILALVGQQNYALDSDFLKKNLLARFCHAQDAKKRATGYGRTLCYCLKRKLSDSFYA